MEGDSDIPALPENCIANIISLTSPVDACRMAVVAPIFQSAAESSVVWERFLPSNYRDIISRASPDSPIHSYPSEKALYLYLCDNPILIDCGGKSFWLEKQSGKKCCRVSAKHMWVVWGDMATHWGWVSHPNSRFATVGELLNICWLEMSNNVDISMLSPGTTYAAYFVYATNAAFSGLDDQTVQVFAHIGDQERIMNDVSLVPLDETFRRLCNAPAPRKPHDPLTNHPRLRDDGWLEVEMGEFSILAGGEGHVAMGLFGVQNMNWKSGIVFEGFEIRPICLQNNALVEETCDDNDEKVGNSIGMLRQEYYEMIFSKVLRSDSS